MMDALEFLKARKRMCEATKCASCKLCHMQRGCFIAPENEEIDACEEAIAIVEQWATAHPVKTRQSVFLEQWPEAFYSDGLLQICPACVTRSFRGRVGECVVEPKNCQKCKKDFWLAEVEE
jgi:hypothetical protein|nr:MAG TPA: hypothetical protein [Caudoviricetes sp.]